MEKENHISVDNKHLNEFINMSLDTLTESDLTRLLEKTASNLKQILDCEYVAIGILDRGKYISFIQSGFTKEIVSKIGSIPQGRGILGEIINKDSVMIVEDIKSHESYTGFPKYHPDMNNLIAKGLFNGNEKLGRVYVANKEIGFSEEDEKILELAGKLISRSIMHVRMNNTIKENEVELQISSLKRDLHDSALQNLIAVNMQLELIKSNSSNAGVAEIMDSTIAASKKVIEDLYDLLNKQENLPIGYENLSFELEDIIYRATTISNIDFEFEYLLDFDVSSSMANTLLTIVQESVSNIVKHSKSTTAKIKVFKEGDYLNILITDNGVGFNEDSIKKGFGLKNIKIRAIEHGGDVQINSHDEKTVIHVTLLIN